MTASRLTELLRAKNVQFTTIPHRVVYTAQETAAAAHIPPKDLAKTVVVKVDGTMVMAVVPASTMVVLDSLKEAMKAKEVELATEGEFRFLFPECDVGAMPPFGNLYGIYVVADVSLADSERIAFNAGTHGDVIEMAYADFERLVQPRLARIARQRQTPTSQQPRLWESC